MKRRKSQKRRPWAAVARNLLVVALALVVLWQFGHSFVPEGKALTGETVARAYITTSDVNLRSGPGTSHDVLSVLPVKTGIAVTGDAQHGFLPVELNGQRAWIAADYVAPEDSVLAATMNVPDAPDVPEPTAVPTEAPTEVPTQAPASEMLVAEVEVEVETDEPEPEPQVYAATTSGTVKPEVADVGAGERWVEIDRTRSTVTLHEGNRIVAVYDGLMGKDPSTDGYYATAVGTHYVFSMERELTETPFAPGVYLTDWVGFDPERSNGIHSPVRDAEGNVVATGGTVTLGCVRLGAAEARAVYDFAFIGMRVEVHD
jgi:lipoprotein-anchoring transpeptidase ErfK/SrfK